VDLPVHPDDEDAHYGVHQDTHVQYVPLTYHGLALRPQIGVSSKNLENVDQRR
jgi:hypothetical protein